MEKVKIKRLTAMKAIRAKCVECCAGQQAEVRKCHLWDCPLWMLRFGKGPKLAPTDGFYEVEKPDPSNDTP
jgi:hypothetical protein